MLDGSDYSPIKKNLTVLLKCKQERIMDIGGGIMCYLKS